MRRLVKYLALCGAIASVATLSGARTLRGQSDALERAMRNEMTRSIKELQLGQLARPYFIAYRATERQGVSASAMNGSLLSSSEHRGRGMTPEIRVGDYSFDNTNFNGSSGNMALIAFGGGGGELELVGGGLPLDDNYLELRRQIWLETDAVYKMAAEAFAAKRAALLNRAGRDSLPDFSRVAPVQVVDTLPSVSFARSDAEALARSLSALPELARLDHSVVQLSAGNWRTLMLNTEGTRTVEGRSLISVSASATAQAADGAPLGASVRVFARSAASLPSREQLATAIRTMAARIDSLRRAPVLERYSGPVLFDGGVAAELFAESFAPALVGRRRAASGQPDFAAMMEASGRGVASFTDRIGSRVLPRFLSVVDDPTVSEQDGVPLFGSYRVDDDGVPARRNVLVDSGIVTQVLTTRVPVQSGLTSTGNRRGDGAAPSNLLVTATGGLSEADLKARLLALVKERGLPYGMIVRELGSAVMATNDPMAMMSAMRGQGTGRSLLLAYRLYPDGREELVRGARLAEFSTQSFKDIVAVSSTRTAFHHIVASGSFPIPFEMLDQMGMNLGASQPLASYVVPSMLFEDLSLERATGEQPKPPLSPPPTRASR